MTLPTFLMIGTAKAGTTSLDMALDQHPEVFMSPIKETNYFATGGEPFRFEGPGDDQRINATSVHEFEEYRSLFSKADGYRAVGEVSPLYMYFPQTAERIRRTLPEAKLFAILRNPVDRAYSAFLMLRRDGREPVEDFATALRAEERRIAEGWQPIWHYKQMGFYHSQLVRFCEVFPREQLRIFLYEEYRSQPERTFRRIWEFLGVDPSFRPSRFRRNVSGLPRSSLIQRFLTRPHPLKSAFKLVVSRSISTRLGDLLRSKNLVKPPISRGIRQQLVSEYETDIRRLEVLLGRDLSAWRRIDNEPSHVDP